LTMGHGQRRLMGVMGVKGVVVVEGCTMSKQSGG
jgi:hypothetical protein